MTLKILGGRFKGRALLSPPEKFARPTTSMLRKAVFDICQQEIEGARFLDLFACTGAMGIEAISRGASHATFVEQDRKIASLLRENLHKFEIEEEATVLIGNALDPFRLLQKSSSPFTLVYVDPPYPLIQKYKDSFLALLHKLETSDLLDPSCTIFFEEAAPGVLPFDNHSFSHLLYKGSRRFSSALLHQFKLNF